MDAMCLDAMHLDAMHLDATWIQSIAVLDEILGYQRTPIQTQWMDSE